VKVAHPGPKKLIDTVVDDSVLPPGAEGSLPKAPAIPYLTPLHLLRIINVLTPPGAKAPFSRLPCRFADS